MPLLNGAAEMQPEISAWRRELHQRPELMFDVHETARFVEANCGVSAAMKSSPVWGGQALSASSMDATAADPS